jgi:signal transduction histidine kinase
LAFADGRADGDNDMVTSVVSTPQARPRRGRARGVLTAALRAPVSGRTWREVGYCLVSLPLTFVGFALVLAALLAGTALTVTVVGAVLGMVLLLAGLSLATGVAGVQRRLARAMLGLRVPAPPPEPRTARGVFGRLEAPLRSGRNWRAVAYVLIRCPLGYLGTWLIAGFWFAGLLYLSYPVTWTALHGHEIHGGAGERPVPVLSPFPAGGVHITTIGEAFLIFLLGVPVLLAAPWVTRGVVAVDSWLLRHLLAPVSLTARVRELERSRALAVDDADARLRRVERDLHDGAQARLVAIAMTLGMAKEKLGDDASPADAARVRALVDTAHANAKEAITEVRDLARGIHPPVLDNGLPDALATLAAQSAVPVAVVADIDPRPTPAIEAIAYFCAAELIANVAKHSGASSASLEAAAGDGTLRLRVWDNGKGGAAARPGSGLAGLAERVRTVDGSLDIDSPAGGPTAVRVELPLHA